VNVFGLKEFYNRNFDFVVDVFGIDVGIQLNSWIC